MGINQKQTGEGIRYQEKEPEWSVGVDANKIKEAADQRSKEQNIFRRVLNLFKKDKHFSELFVSGVLSHKRVALLVDGLLEAFEMETDHVQLFGSIFKGSIQNLEPGLKAAFVDIGQDKNAFLHYWDILPLLNGEGYNEHNKDDSIEIIRSKKRVSDQPEIPLEAVPEKVPVGSDLIVQVIKGKISTKGPRVTTNVTLLGRYLILTPYSAQCGISKKIESKREQDRLKRILGHLTVPEGMGVVFRTASCGCSLRHLVRDLQVLLDTWRRIQEQAAQAQGPALLYAEPTLLERVVRDFLTEEVDRVLVDNEADYAFICDRVKQIAPHLLKKIQLYREPIPIFDRFNIESQIDQVLATRIPLPSGGEIVIQETEALTAVDVNTSAHKDKGNGDKTFIFQVNMEAAREIVRQIRLRNLGGVTIVDFVDMKQAKSRSLLFEFVKKELEADKAHTQVFPLTPLGLMQISRQRHAESLHSQLYIPCGYCGGEGKLKSYWTLWLRVQRDLWAQRQGAGEDPLAFRVVVHPIVKNNWVMHFSSAIQAVEHKWSLQLHLGEDPQMHLEQFQLTRL